jgi:type IV secretory pathway component VirB8
MATDKSKNKIKYTEIVADIVDGGYYFKDAMDWYCLKYLNAVAERTLFILLSIISFFVMLFLYMTVKNILPLKEAFPILVRQADGVNYYTTVTKIKPDTVNYTSNEAILRFLLMNYVRDLFTHDYKTGNIEDLNAKLNKIKLLSSSETFERYRSDFNKVSAEMFNKRVDQRVIIRSFKFIKKNETDKKKVIMSLFLTELPAEAEISYTRVFNNNENITTFNEKILLSYKYEPIKYNNIKKEFTKPTLVVTTYKVEEQK